jgi:hypothetical protein
MPKQSAAKPSLVSNPQIDANILLVEGPDDFHFAIAFLNQHGLYEQIRCQDSEGVNRLLKNLPLWLKPSALQRLGIAELAVQQIPAEERLFPPQHEIKAKVHTWLAWQEEPGMPMGRSITKGRLNVNAPQALVLIDWLRRLFVELL